MNGRERESAPYDPRPAYPPPPSAREQKTLSKPTMIHREGRFSTGKFYVIMCFVAFGLLLISGILGGTVLYLEEPDEEDYRDDESNYRWAGDTPEEQDANEKAYKDAGESYEDSSRNLGATRVLFMNCGIVVLTFGLVIGAITDKSLSKRTKLGMLIAAGIIVAFSLGSPGQVTNYFWNP
ncbi:MAG: hypothetical protein QF682_10865 [Candidatus Thermoplasmatota archaeon]|nr:hypothetical protein [Candidatus Thermoplasmatota archaeon]